VYQQINWFVNRTDKEISGLGTVEIIDGVPIVTDVYMLKQECTGASTDIDQDAMMDLILHAHKKGKVLNYWWHSHADMGVFWSGTDTATIKQFGGNGVLYSTVFNRKGNLLSSYYQACTKDFPQVYIENFPTSIGSPLRKQEEEVLENLFKQYVTDRTPIMSNFFNKKITYLGDDVDDDLLYPEPQRVGTYIEEFADQEPTQPENILIRQYLINEYGEKGIENATAHYQYYYGAGVPTWEELHDHIELQDVVATKYIETVVPKRRGRPTKKTKKGRK